MDDLRIPIMPIPKTEVTELLPCTFYEPADLFDPELLYTVPEIARLMQGLDADASLDPETESILIDWAIPWIMVHADQLVVAEPDDEDDPGYYGLARQ